MINITLPDSSIKTFENPISVEDLSKSIGAGLAKATVAGKVNGNLVDAVDLLESDCSVEIIRDQDQEGIEMSVTYILMLLVILIFGPGKYFSLDYWVLKK